MLKWHYPLGHINVCFMNLTNSHNLVTCLSDIKLSLPLCQGCLFGKQTKLTYPLDGTTRGNVLLALIHTYFCGPMHTPYFGGAFSFPTFINNFLRFATMCLLTKKSKVSKYFKNYKWLVENQIFYHKILIPRSDNEANLYLKPLIHFVLIMAFNPHLPLHITRHRTEFLNTKIGH